MRIWYANAAILLLFFEFYILLLDSTIKKRRKKNLIRRWGSTLSREVMDIEYCRWQMREHSKRQFFQIISVLCNTNGKKRWNFFLQSTVVQESIPQNDIIKTNKCQSLTITSLEQPRSVCHLRSIYTYNKIKIENKKIKNIYIRL